MRRREQYRVHKVLHILRDSRGKRLVKCVFEFTVICFRDCVPLLKYMYQRPSQRERKTLTPNKVHSEYCPDTKMSEHKRDPQNPMKILRPY